MSKYTKRFSSFNFPAVIALIAIIFQNIFPVVMLSPLGTTQVYAGDGSNFSYNMEGKVLDGAWTKGNLCQGSGDCYREGDKVPFRLTIGGLTTGGSYSVIVQRDFMNSPIYGYETLSEPSIISNHVGASNVNFGNENQVACGGSVFCKNTTISFTADAETATIYFDGKLGINASEWNGSSLHMRMLEGISGDNAGNNDIPIGVGKILKLPQLTITKSLSGDEGEYTAADWCFDISPSVGDSSRQCITGLNGDSVDTVVLDNLQATSYTITEAGPDGYSNVGVDGVNCTPVSDGVATATVAPGTDPTNASCTFTNTRQLGTLKVMKDVVGPNGEDIVDTSELFDMTVDAGDGEQFSLTDNGTKTWENIPTGVYTIEELDLPEGYEWMEYSIDQDPEIDGAQVLVTTGQETVLTVTNRQVGGTLNVTKQVLDAIGIVTDDSRTFEITLNDSEPYALQGGQTKVFENLLPGTYTIGEQSLPTGYSFVGFSDDEDQLTDDAQITVYNNSDAYLTITNQQDLSLLEVRKTDDVDPVSAGNSFNYTITAENKGPHTIHNVSVNDALPAPFQLVSTNPSMGICNNYTETDSFKCSFGDLEVGETATVVVSVSVPSDTAPDTYENTAYVSAYEYPEPLMASETTIVTDDYDLKLTKEASVDSIVAGDTNGFDYTIVVENLGPSVAKGLLLLDTIPDEISVTNLDYDSTMADCSYSAKVFTCTVDTLEVGEKLTFVIDAMVQPDVSAQSVENVVTVGSSEGDWRATDTVLIQEDINLLITKVDNVDQVAAGQGFVYTITVQNSPEALSQADGVILMDKIPSQFKPTRVDNDKCRINGNDLMCELGDMLPGDTPIEINVLVEVPASTQAGDYENTAYVRSREGDENKASVTTPVVEESSLWIRKTDSVDPVVAGGRDFVYTIGIGNNGPSTADDVILVDHLPPQFQYVSYSVESDDLKIRCKFGDPVARPLDPTYSGREALSCMIGSVDPGQTGLIRLRVNVPASVDTQTVMNYADVISPDGDDASVEESTDVVEDVKLVVAKWDQYDPGEFAVAGDDDAVYTIKVWNDGLSDADNVIVRDELPEEFSFVSADERCKYLAGPHVVMCEIGDLPAGEENAIELVIVASVDPDVEATMCHPFVDAIAPAAIEFAQGERPLILEREGCGYRNDVFVRSDEDRTRDSEWTPVVEIDKIRVNKRLRSDNPHVAGEDSVKFKVVVKNLGPSTAEKVEMWDDLSQILDYYDDPETIEYKIKTSSGMTCEDIDFDNKGIYCYIGDLGVKGWGEDSWKEWMTIEFSVPDYFETGRYVNIAEAWSGGCYPEPAFAVHTAQLGDQVAVDWVPENGQHPEVQPDDTCSWDEDKGRFDVIEESKVVVEKEANPDEVMAGHPIDGYVDYPVTITNEGPSTVEDVMGVDYLPWDFTYVSNDNDWCEYDEYDHAVYCTINELGVGETFEFSVRVFVEADVFEGPYTNTAMAFSPECVPLDYDWGEPGEEEEEEGEGGEDFGYVCDFDEAEVDVEKMPDPVVDIIKTNSWLGSPDPLSPGDVVEYKITVGVDDYPVRDLTIFDILPQGMTYVAGSANAVIDGSSCLIRPDSLLPAMNREFVGRASVGYPDYSNGIGMWYVGSVDPCQQVILTYEASVDEDATPGELRDISWARGKTLADDPVFAQAVPEDSSFVSERVVGTYVAVAVPTDEGGEVLGAATSTLPATGIPTYRTILAVIAILSGLMLIFSSQIVEFFRKRKSFFKGMTYSMVFLALLFGASMFMFQGEVSAQVSSIQLSQPKSPTSDNTFGISYVAANSEGAFDVVCKVSKDGGTYTTFDSGSHSITGSGSCSVTSATMSDEGIYSFKAVLQPSVGSAIESSVVKVAYDNTSPEAPTDYEKEVYGTCSNQVSFTVPEDSGIVEVRVYRATTQPFTANADSLIITRSVSEGEQVTLSDDISDCTQKYYYALRAIDASGNSSDYTGDHTATVAQVVTPTTTTTTATGEQIETTSEDAQPELVGENSDDGEVLGEGEENSENGENGEESDSTDENGDEDEDSEENDNGESGTEEFLRQYGVFLVLGVGLIVVGFYLYRRSQRGATV